MMQMQENLEKQVDRNTAKLDKIIWLLAIVCAELGLTGVMVIV